MREPILNYEVEYRIKDNHFGRWITNKPTAQEYANYNALRSNARKFNGLDEIDIDWDKHLIEVSRIETKETRKVYNFEDLEEVEQDE